MSQKKHGGSRGRGEGRESLRAFVAVPPGAALREALGHTRASLEDTAFSAGLRWVPPENLHLTLRFLAEVALADLPLLVSTLRETLRETQRFEVPVGEITLFPSLRRPRALATVFPAHEALAALAARVEEAVRDSGLPGKEQRFRPHITLARFRRGQRATPLPRLHLPAARLEVHALHLVRSVLGPSGAHYTTLENFELTEPSRLSR